MILIVIGKTAPSVYNLINHKTVSKDVIPLLIFLAIFLVLLIFNEVIELNCFKLERNTTRNIQKRAIREYEQEMNNKNEDESSSSSDSSDLGDININENEEIEQKEQENKEPNYFIYASSM